ncbi:MAG TPA: 2Fe-2S iron-sulfur cluster-binding protein [Alphaproteobacteria bacterium]|nr:2Fe-2S iron-sulfur cluster-binding protein [Alphaproteobacteria bacterium]
MTAIRLTVNGRKVAAEVEPRLQLADFLRDHLLHTGTHQGCEHGVCGACTLLIDGVPARSCITYAVSCDGAEITTIEGMDADETMAELRRAFTREHALQCGFCTPGMLATARDIVLRLPEADERRIRLELSGNLCRCTGYVGIVRAIKSVLAERKGTGRPRAAAPARRLGPVGAREGTASSAIAPAAVTAAAAATAPAPQARPAARPQGVGQGIDQGIAESRPGTLITQSFTLSEPLERVWLGFKDVELLAACLPGAALTAPLSDNRVEGVLRIKLGPISASFAGEGDVHWDDAQHRGVIRGGGRDSSSSSQARGEIEFALSATPEGGTRVDVQVGFSLAGPLAQFSRGAIVNDLAERLSAEFARNLDARIGAAARGEAGPAAPAAELRAGSLLLSVLWSRIKRALRRLLGRR